jgi:hypothetical protein
VMHHHGYVHWGYIGDWPSWPGFGAIRSRYT